MKHFRWSTAKVVFVFLEERRLRANIQVKKTPGINLGKGTDSQWLLWISDFVNSQKWKKHRIQIDSWNNPPPIILCLRYLWAWEPSRFVTRSGFHWSVIQSVLNLRTGTSFIGPRFALLDLKATSNLIYHDKKKLFHFSNFCIPTAEFEFGLTAISHPSSPREGVFVRVVLFDFSPQIFNGDGNTNGPIIVRCWAADTETWANYRKVNGFKKLKYLPQSQWDLFWLTEQGLFILLMSKWKFLTDIR